MKGKVHPGDEMTSRGRLLAAYRGEAVDRLPFWAKVANNTWRLGQPDRIRRLGDAELLDYIGADGIFGVGRAVRAVRPRAASGDSVCDHTRTTVTRTPDGELREVWRQDPATASWHPVEFPVKTRRDLKRCRWLYEDVRFQADEDALSAGGARQERIGDRGITKTSHGTSPLMHLVEHVVGPINTHLMLADFPREMDELIELMHGVQLRQAEEVARRTPADLVVSVENTSTSLISPGQFERYCWRHLCDYGRAIRSAGKIHELHMCGLLKVLLGRIDAIPAASIEAFTAPTLANTRLADGRAEAPSKCLVGGTNCMVWLAPPEEIRRFITNELAACRDHRRIVLTTAGVAPPACRAETFRQIARWLPTVPVRL